MTVDMGQMRVNLSEKLQPFSTDRELKVGEARCVSTGSRQTFDQTGTGRVGYQREYHRDASGMLTYRGQPRRALRDDDVWISADECSGFRGHSLVVASTQPSVDGKVAAFRPSQLVQLGSECRQQRTHFRFAEACHNTHEALPVLLLRPRRERPRGHRAAEKRDELTAPHSITSSARSYAISAKF
jgi:hypothetical protein